MKICYLGDANVQVRRVAEYFAGTGDEVHLVTARPKPLPGIDVHDFTGPLARGRSAFILGVPSARRLVRRLRPDLIHVFYATSYGLVASMIPGPPVALSPMGTDVLISARQSRLSEAMVRRAIRRADVVFSVAPHMTRRLIELGAVPSGIHTFPRGVDLERFVLPTRKGDPDRPVIVSVRKLEPVYNIEQLIRAVPLVLEHHPRAEFVIYGEGVLRRELGSLAVTEGVAAKVRFAGSVEHDRIPEILSQGDIYVSCARSDGASVSLLEAMASGLYPIVSDIEANRTWIREGNGDLVPLDDPPALADRICRAISRLGREGDLRVRNRTLIQERASWSSNMPRMKSVYQDLVRGRRPGASA